MTIGLRKQNTINMETTLIGVGHISSTTLKTLSVQPETEVQKNKHEELIQFLAIWCQMGNSEKGLKKKIK